MGTISQLGNKASIQEIKMYRCGMYQRKTQKAKGEQKQSTLTESTGHMSTFPFKTTQKSTRGKRCNSAIRSEQSSETKQQSSKDK